MEPRGVFGKDETSKSTALASPVCQLGRRTPCSCLVHSLSIGRQACPKSKEACRGHQRRTYRPWHRRGSLLGLHGANEHWCQCLRTSTTPGLVRRLGQQQLPDVLVREHTGHWLVWVIHIRLPTPLRALCRAKHFPPPARLGILLSRAYGTAAASASVSDGQHLTGTHRLHSAPVGRANAILRVCSQSQSGQWRSGLECPRGQLHVCVWPRVSLDVA